MRKRPDDGGTRTETGRAGPDDDGISIETWNTRTDDGGSATRRATSDGGRSRIANGRTGSNGFNGIRTGGGEKDVMVEKTGSPLDPSEAVATHSRTVLAT